MRLLSEAPGYAPKDFDVEDYQIFKQAHLAYTKAGEEYRAAETFGQTSIKRIIDTICQQLEAHKDTPIYVTFNEHTYGDKDNRRKIISLTIEHLRQLREPYNFTFIEQLQACLVAYQTNQLGWQPSPQIVQQFQSVVDTATQLAPVLENILNPHIEELSTTQREIAALGDKYNFTRQQFELNKPTVKLKQRIYDARREGIQAILDRAREKNETIPSSSSQKSIHRSLVTVTEKILSEIGTYGLFGRAKENIFESTINEYKPLQQHFVGPAKPTDFVKSQLLQLQAIVIAFDKDIGTIEDYGVRFDQEILALFEGKPAESSSRAAKEEDQKRQTQIEQFKITTQIITLKLSISATLQATQELIKSKGLTISNILSIDNSEIATRTGQLYLEKLNDCSTALREIENTLNQPAQSEELLQSLNTKLQNIMRQCNPLDINLLKEIAEKTEQHQAREKAARQQQFEEQQRQAREKAARQQQLEEQQRQQKEQLKQDDFEQQLALLAEAKQKFERGPSAEELLQDLDVATAEDTRLEDSIRQLKAQLNTPNGRKNLNVSAELERLQTQKEENARKIALLNEKWQQFRDGTDRRTSTIIELVRNVMKAAEANDNAEKRLEPIPDEVEADVEKKKTIEERRRIAIEAAEKRRFEKMQPSVQTIATEQQFHEEQQHHAQEEMAKQQRQALEDAAKQQQLKEEQQRRAQEEMARQRQALEDAARQQQLKEKQQRQEQQRRLNETPEGQYQLALEPFNDINFWEKIDAKFRPSLNQFVQHIKDAKEENKIPLADLTKVLKETYTLVDPDHPLTALQLKNYKTLAYQMQAHPISRAKKIAGLMLVLLGVAATIALGATGAVVATGLVATATLLGTIGLFAATRPRGLCADMLDLAQDQQERLVN